MIADDLFAGAGGWDLAANQLGIHARQGAKGKQFLQAGNAIPPGLALHALAAATGINTQEAAA